MVVVVVISTVVVVVVVFKIQSEKTLPTQRIRRHTHGPTENGGKIYTLKRKEKKRKENAMDIPVEPRKMAGTFLMCWSSSYRSLMWM